MVGGKREKQISIVDEDREQRRKWAQSSSINFHCGGVPPSYFPGAGFIRKKKKQKVRSQRLDFNLFQEKRRRRRK